MGKPKRVHFAADYEPVGEPNFQVIENLGHDDFIKIYGYRKHAGKSFLYYLLCLLFFGIPYILVVWFPDWRKFWYKKCSLQTADVLVVDNNSDQKYLIKVEHDTDDKPHITSFTFQHSKYIWDSESQEFRSIKLFEKSESFVSILQSRALNADDQRKRRRIYGRNKISVEVKSYWLLFVNEVFNPFYIFQVFSITLWSLDEYYQYAVCVLALSLFSIVTTLYKIKKQSIAVHNLVERSSSSTVDILRPSDLETTDFHSECIDATLLVPSDLISIPSKGCVMPCDAVLLTGTCIVNESMLTGESIPVTKTPPPPSQEMYNISAHRRHTLFAGTQVLQTRYYGSCKVVARVVNTGFNTSKGELVKSILNPKSIGIQFYKDAVKFVAFLFFIASTGMGYSIHLYIKRKANLETILLRTLDIITIVVPPALPAALTVGTVFSQNRLRKKKIFCVSPPKINVAGKTKLICFDKTGTLTDDSLEFHGAAVTCDHQTAPLIHNVKPLDEKSAFIQAMATCHSLTFIDDQLNGDPIDLVMFKAVHWELEEPGVECTRYDMLAPTIVRPMSDPSHIQGEAAYQIGIIRQFPFSSARQGMSVICRVLGAPDMLSFAKGAPEMIRELCQPASVPQDFDAVLQSFAASGHRVIALASKTLPKKFTWMDAQKVRREEIEADFTFLGFLVFRNALKPETVPVMRDLQEAKLRTVMVTGDNVRTAISVGRECGMLLPHERIIILSSNILPVSADGAPLLEYEVLSGGSETSDSEASISIDSMESYFAFDGKTWNVLRMHYSDWIDNILVHTKIFARFGPDQKTQLVQHFQGMGYVVAMVGDGANDCGALKAAHIGISLSQAEASVAAPFTSSEQNISCIKHLVLEGRCSLVTSFALFKYMALYSLIQCFSVLILYSRHSTLGSMQFLFIDLIITTSLAVTMGRQGPASKLVPKRPVGSLVSLSVLTPMVLQVALCALVQVGSIYFLFKQPWFTPLTNHEHEIVLCWENTVIFVVSCFQYLILAYIYSKGKPFRKSVNSNVLFLLNVLCLAVFIVFVFFCPVKIVSDFLEVIPSKLEKQDIKFRLEVLCFPLAHVVLSFVIESLMSERRWFKKVTRFLRRKKRPKNAYKYLLKYDVGVILEMITDRNVRSQQVL